MELRILLVFGLLCYTGISIAQTDFRPGYIIENSGDTIYGQIDYRGDQLMSRICKFKSENKKVVEYLPEDLKAFRFIDSKYYVSKDIESGRCFFEYLIQGKVNIYYLRNKDVEGYYLEKEASRLIQLPYEEKYRHIDNKKVLLESNRHIGILKYTMQDAPELHSQIERLGKPNHKSLINLAKDYHNIVCEDEKCTIYTKETPFLKVNPEIVGGIINYNNINDSEDQFFKQYGLITHFWLPRVNEKIFFRTGIIYSEIPANDDDSRVYYIPIHLEYIYPKGIFRPRISYGLNYYFKEIANTISVNLGGNIKLYENLFLSTTTEFQFVPLEFFQLAPRSMLSYSVRVGLFYRFR